MSGLQARPMPRNCREELGVVGGEEVVADVRVGVDDAVGEGVVGGAAVGFVPAVGIFVAEAGGRP